MPPDSFLQTAGITGSVVAGLGMVLFYFLKREIGRLDQNFKAINERFDKLVETSAACTLNFMEKFRTKAEAAEDSKDQWSAINGLKNDLAECRERLGRIEERNRMRDN